MGGMGGGMNFNPEDFQNFQQQNKKEDEEEKKRRRIETKIRRFRCWLIFV